MTPLGPVPNARQRDAIRTTERHVLLAAGAGTGKTFTVVRRVLHLLGVPIEGVAPRAAPPRTLDEIAAITFTRAAAAELREALRAALRDCGRDADAFAVDSARIGTIHNFCGDLLREHALRGGYAPALHMLNEGETQAFAREASAQVLNEALEGSAQPALTDLAITHGLSSLKLWIARLATDGDRLRWLQPGNPAEAMLLELTRTARTRLQHRLDGMRSIDCDRTLVDARDVLAARPDVLAAARRRLHTLIVDEYQDVDPVQHEIAWLLADPVRGGASTPRLLLVGDPKQGGYRFRRADVTLWREAERHFRDGAGEIISLEENRGSVPAILNFIAATVGAELSQPLEGRELAEFEVPFAAMTPVRSDPEEPAVEVLLIPPGSDGGRRRTDDARLAEAEAIARRAQEFHQTGISWGEMALLLPDWTALSLYAQALERHGVPHYSLRGEGFLERREVLDCLLALEAVRDPNDDRALVGWLRSPFVALRDDTLLALAQSGVRPMAEALRAPELPEAERRLWAAETLATHVQLRDRVPTRDLLERLLEHSGYVAHLAARGERQAIANVRKFVALIDRASSQSLGDVLRLIQEQREGSVRLPDARLYDVGEDVVTLTSMHAAKGLEWDVVFWADVRCMPPDMEDGLLIGRRDIALRDPDQKNQPQRVEQLIRQEALEEQAQRKRLWYVVATRAKSHLVVSGVSQGHGKIAVGTAEDMLYRRLELLKGTAPGVYRIGRGSASFSVRVHRALEPEAPVKIGSRPLAVPPGAPPVRLPSGRRRESATSLRLFERCPERYWFRYVAGLAEPAEGESAGAQAMVTGTLVHEVLERLSVEADVATLVSEVVGESRELDGSDATLLEAYRDAVAREVAMVEQHAGYRVMRELPSARRELRFVELLGPDRALEGVIDLAAMADDGYALLDVKTGQGRGASAAERAASYRAQADVYAGAVETIAGRPAAHFAFHFSRTGEQHVQALNPAARLAARERVRALMARIASGERSLTDDPAECEKCGYRLVGWCPGIVAVPALSPSALPSPPEPSAASTQRTGGPPQFSFEL